MTLKLDEVMKRISDLEFLYNDIKLDQSRLDIQLNSLQDVICKQQNFIERTEIANPQCNIILICIPEEEVIITYTPVSDDTQKVVHICREISNDFGVDDIEVSFRIEIKKNGKTQPIKVKFNNKVTRDIVLHNQRVVRYTNAFSWGKHVFVNRYLPPLTRAQEQSLRRRLKSEIENAVSGDKLYPEWEIV